MRRWLKAAEADNKDRLGKVLRCEELNPRLSQSARNVTRPLGSQLLGLTVSYSPGLGRRLPDLRFRVVADKDQISDAVWIRSAQHPPSCDVRARSSSAQSMTLVHPSIAYLNGLVESAPRRSHREYRFHARIAARRCVAGMTQGSDAIRSCPMQ
jgi:hypothetical protein